VLTTEPDDQTAGRIMLTCIFLIALVVAGFVVGLVWWPELMPWSRWSAEAIGSHEQIFGVNEQTRGQGLCD
jgi:hypothetical protein